MGKTLIKFIALALLYFAASSCSSVKGIEKYYLSEPNMQLEDGSVYLFEKNAAIYREGASGANGGKAGGGCGCH